MLASCTATSAGFGAAAQQCRQRIEIDNAIGVDRRDAIGLERLGCVFEHGVVLDCRDDQRRRARAAPAPDAALPSRREVNTTFSARRVDQAAAIFSRASSISARARRPAPCTDEGLPPAASARVIATDASARMGAPAL